MTKHADPMTNEGNSPKRIRLFQHDNGATLCTIDLSILPDGSLQLSNYDLGEAPQQFVGHDDYEYSVTVPPEHKDRLLLALLKAKYDGDGLASSHFSALLDTEKIPYAFDTWP